MAPRRAAATADGDDAKPARAKKAKNEAAAPAKTKTPSRSPRSKASDGVKKAPRTPSAAKTPKTPKVKGALPSASKSTTGRVSSAARAAVKPRATKRKASSSSSSGKSSRGTSKRTHTVSEKSQRTWRPISQGVRRLIGGLLRDCAAVVIASSREVRQAVVLEYLNKLVSTLDAHLTGLPAPVMAAIGPEDRLKLFQMARQAEAQLMDDLRQASFLEGSLEQTTAEAERLQSLADDLELQVQAERDAATTPPKDTSDQDPAAQLLRDAKVADPVANAAQKDRQLREALGAAHAKLVDAATQTKASATLASSLYEIENELKSLLKQLGREDEIARALL